MNSNGPIDLSFPSSTYSTHRRSSDMYARRQSNSSSHHPTKRRRLDNSGDNNENSAAGPSHTSRHRQTEHNNESGNNDIESIDLTEVNDSSTLSKILAKQREDAVKAQHTNADDEGGRSALTAYRCPVCMDVAEDATTTVCGHLFCHRCIMDSLRVGEERRALDSHSKTLRGNCPVCRKQLTRADTPGAKRNLVPLQLKLSTKKRR